MKKILNNIITVISWIILIFAFIVTVIVFSADRNNGVPDLFGVVPLTVESDSMSPVFVKDDMSIDKEIDDVYQLENGDIITFWTLIDGHRVKNTHRIICVNDIDGNINFSTKGDNNDTVDNYLIEKKDIIAESKCIIKYIGFPSLWLSEMW